MDLELELKKASSGPASRGGVRFRTEIQLVGWLVGWLVEIQLVGSLFFLESMNGCDIFVSNLPR